jgi:Ca2+:H+ antiporter
MVTVNEIRIIVLEGPLNFLLIAIPISLSTYWLSVPDGITFIFALVALAPLAERLGFITEQLALHTNDTIGGLLNATFGNATELIVAVIALYKKLYRLVQLSLLGSILSNMLLVLGTAFLFGGVRHKEQRFNKAQVIVPSNLLMLSTMAILFPTVLVLLNGGTMSDNLKVSRGSSALAFCLYVALIYFQVS